MSQSLIQKVTEFATEAAKRGPEYLPVLEGLIESGTKLIQADGPVSLETLQNAERMVNETLAKIDVRNG